MDVALLVEEHLDSFVGLTDFDTLAKHRSLLIYGIAQLDTIAFQVAGQNELEILAAHSWHTFFKISEM